MITPEPVPLSWPPVTLSVTTLFSAVAAAAGALPASRDRPALATGLASVRSSRATVPPPATPPSTAVRAATATSRRAPPVRAGRSSVAAGAPQVELAAAPAGPPPYGPAPAGSIRCVNSGPPIGAPVADSGPAGSPRRANSGPPTGGPLAAVGCGPAAASPARSSTGRPYAPGVPAASGRRHSGPAYGCRPADEGRYGSCGMWGPSGVSVML